ncbi:MAG: hypothetical protein V1820_05725 [archaeon]
MADSYKQWDAKPELVRKYGFDWPDTREPARRERPGIAFVVGTSQFDGKMLGEDLSILSLRRALSRECGWEIPVYVDCAGTEKTAITKTADCAGISWQGNMGSDEPLSVSHAAGIYGRFKRSFSKALALPKGTLYNLIDSAIYGSTPCAPWLVKKMEKLEDRYSGRKPLLLELLGLDPGRPTIVHHGRLNRDAVDPKGYCIDGVFERMNVGDYNFLFFGPAPDHITIKNLRDRGASVVTALDTTQIDDSRMKNERERCIGELNGVDSEARLYRPQFGRQNVQRACEDKLVIWPFPVGLLSGESRVAAIHLRKGANPLDSSITQMGLTMPVTTISWVFEAICGRKESYVSDGTTEQLPPERLESLVYLSDGLRCNPPGILSTKGGLSSKAADRLAAELEGYLKMPQPEYDKVVGAQRAHIESRFGPEATARRLHNIAEVHQGITA